MQFVTGDRIATALHRAAPFFSFVIGLGIAALLFHRDFLTVKVPAIPLPEIQDKVVRSDGRCYRYRVEDADCENSSVL